jgi:hypothetical protein
MTTSSTSSIVYGHAWVSLLFHFLLLLFLPLLFFFFRECVCVKHREKWIVVVVVAYWRSCRFLFRSGVNKYNASGWQRRLGKSTDIIFYTEPGLGAGTGIEEEYSLFARVRFDVFWRQQQLGRVERWVGWVDLGVGRYRTRFPIFRCVLSAFIFFITRYRIEKK